MAKGFSLLSIFLCSLFLFQSCSCLARNQQEQSQNECQFDSINPLEPTITIQAEAGQTEIWESNEPMFQCAGVELVRHIIQSRGLLLPSYSNAPKILYIEQGSGMYGLLKPGCPESFQSSQISQQQIRSGEEEQKGQRGQRFQDRHQKIANFRQGDVLTIPAGTAFWMYNEADLEAIAVSLHDTSNKANQLDQNHRMFFLAGNPQRQGQQQGRQRPHRSGQQQAGQQEYNSGNVFRGFDTEILIEAFGIDERTARKLQGEEDERGHIVRVDDLQVIRPPMIHREEEQQESQRGVSANGIEETVCSARDRENIDNPSRADIYNPRAGRYTSLNSYTLPILSYLQLSIERGILFRNAIFAPHWFMNCHNVMYVTRGDSRVQIVDHKGQAVFDGQIRAGQVLVVPQNYAILKQAGEEGCEWVGFNTADNALINTLTGRTSAIRGLPIDVIANSYQISREDASKLKFSRDQTLIFESRSSSRSGSRAASA